MIVWNSHYILPYKTVLLVVVLREMWVSYGQHINIYLAHNATDFATETKKNSLSMSNARTPGWGGIL